MPQNLDPNFTQPLAKNEYRCAMCHQIYTKAWSDEEAVQEQQQYWPSVSLEECAIVCDDCWVKIYPDQPEIDFLIREWRFNSLLYTSCYPWHHSLFNRMCYVLECRLDSIDETWYRRIWDEFQHP